MEPVTWDVPPIVVTLTGTRPIPTGDTTVIVVPEALTLALAIRVDPKLTVDSGVNPAPVITTVVPPLALPELGAMLVTTGT